MWSTGEGNDKPLQHSCLENPMNSMKRDNKYFLLIQKKVKNEEKKEAKPVSQTEDKYLIRRQTEAQRNTDYVNSEFLYSGSIDIFELDNLLVEHWSMHCQMLSSISGSIPNMPGALP